MSPFDFINSINGSKKDLMTGSENDTRVEKLYVPLIVNKGLSYFPDTILHSNEMNQFTTLPNKLQYHFFLNSIRPAKRFAKWVKRLDSEDFKAVQAYYRYSNDKTLQALKILTPDQLTIIKKIIEKGGNHD